MDTPKENLVLGIGTAGSRAAYYLYQRGCLANTRIVAVDSDAEELSTLPTLQHIQVPRPPSLPVGAQCDQACAALNENLETLLAQAQVMVIVVGLGGETGDFYTQAALRCAQKCEVPAIAFASLPHAFDKEEIQNSASCTLKTLRSQYFNVLALDCAKFGPLFSDDAPENAYIRAVCWLANAVIGYMSFFMPSDDVNGASIVEKARGRRTMEFDSLPTGIFAGFYPTIVNQQNLDIPTFLRLKQDTPSEQN